MTTVNWKEDSDVYRFVVLIRWIGFIGPDVDLVVGHCVFVEKSAFQRVGIVIARRLDWMGTRRCWRRIIRSAGTHFRFGDTTGSVGSARRRPVVTTTVVLRPTASLRPVYLLHHLKFPFRLVVIPWQFRGIVLYYITGDRSTFSYLDSWSEAE